MKNEHDTTQLTLKPGFNLIGQISSNTGLGVAGRAVADLILQRGYQLAIVDVDAGVNRNRANLQHCAHFVEDIQRLPYDTNIVVLGDGGLQSTLTKELANWRTRGYLTAGMGFWELTTLPVRWLPVLDSLDVFIGATEFLQHVHEACLSGPRIIGGRLAHDLPQDITYERARLGLSDDEIVFVTSFEPHSDVERKNVWAVIRAFLQATEGGEHGVLLIKVNNPWQADGGEHPVMQRLRDACAGQSRILILSDSMSYPEVISLYNACDVYVSLHRAEGLGLGIVEAMALGKPVVATGWSGNMTYMNHFNSMPVGYRLIPISKDAQYYRASELEENTLWADPNVEEAAQCMRLLIGDGEMRKELGSAARATIAMHNATAREGKFLDELRVIRARLDGVPRSAESISRQTEARLLQSSRVAQIQRLERELKWLCKPLHQRVAERVKRLAKSIR